MAWNKIKLSANQVDKGMLSKIQKEFDKIFVDQGFPVEMALYIKQDMEITMLYISPLASQHSGSLLTIYNAEVCEPPKEKPLSLFVGSMDSWEVLF